MLASEMDDYIKDLQAVYDRLVQNMLDIITKAAQEREQRVKR